MNRLIKMQFHRASHFDRKWDARGEIVVKLSTGISGGRFTLQTKKRKKKQSDKLL